jgi:hypothetical protein
MGVLGPLCGWWGGGGGERWTNSVSLSPPRDALVTPTTSGTPGAG